MDRAEILKKMAASRPRLESVVGHWGLAAEHKYPLDTVDCVKLAALEFETGVEDMDTGQRLECARAICKRAHDLGIVGVDRYRVHKYAHDRLSPHFAHFLGPRKDAAAHLADDELDKLAKVAAIVDIKADVGDRVKALDKIAGALEAFDRDHDLVGHWGHWFPDPAYTVFGPTLNPDEDIEARIKVAEFEVRREDLESADWSRLEGHVAPEVVEGLKTAGDKFAVFASLPTPEKELVYQHVLAAKE